MRAQLLAALVVLGGIIMLPAAAQAQGWSSPHGCHLGWCQKHQPPEYCCPPRWNWYAIFLRPYPNEYCQSWKGTLEPYDDQGLLLPPTSRMGMMPVSDPLEPPKSSRRPEQLKTTTIKTRQ